MGFDGNLVTVADYEQYCRQVTSPALYEYLYGEPGDPNWSTYTSNRAALEHLELRPRVLVDVSDRRLATTLLGTELSLPVVIGPTGILRDLDPAGEIGTARGAGQAGALFVLSSFSSASAQEVAAAAGGPWWQQVFLYRDRGLTHWQASRAAELGASAIVLTVSNTAQSFHHQTLRFPPASATAIAQEPATHLDGYGTVPAPTYVDLTNDLDVGATWADVDWLRSQTDLPLVIKGIQTAADAQIAVEHGVEGIVVSNHGGRFLQGARGTIAALPEIVEAAGDQAQVSVDGGIRSGEDVLKALALGARTAWVGRAARWAQSVGGQAGIEGLLEIFRRELDAAMGLCGVTDVTAVPRDLVGLARHAAWCEA